MNMRRKTNKCHVKAYNTFYINTGISGHILIFCPHCILVYMNQISEICSQSPVQLIMDHKSLNSKHFSPIKVKTWLQCNVNKQDSTNEEIRSIVDSIVNQSRFQLSTHSEIPSLYVGLHQW